MENIIAFFTLKQKQSIYANVILNANGFKRKVKLAIDTGAYDTIISKDRAENLGFHLKKSKQKTILSATNREIVDIITLESIKVGNCLKQNFQIICKEFPKDLSVDGVLGRSFFENRILIFDFIHGNVSINIQENEL